MLMLFISVCEYKCPCVYSAVYMHVCAFLCMCAYVCARDTLGVFFISAHLYY